VHTSLRDSSTAVWRGVILAGTGGLKRLSLVTFFAAAKKVTAAPHRGNACAAKAQRGCPQKGQKQKRANLRRDQLFRTRNQNPPAGQKAFS
jgi:general secretion pathway protein K